MSENITVAVSGLGGCLRGQLVAYDTALAKYVPAQAAWKQLADGSLRPADSAYVCGLLITSPDASGNGTLLVDGVVSDSTIINILRGSNTLALGPCYLTTNGQVSSNVPAGLLPVYCGCMSAAGVFVFRPAAPNYEGHRHTYYPLSSGGFTSSGGAYQYNVNGNDSQFTQLLTGIPPQALTVVHSGGLIVAGTDYTISGNALIGLRDNSGYAVCGINPFIATNPEVRAVAAAPGNNITSVTQLYGTVYIDDTYPITTSNAVTGTCVAAISHDGVQTAPVVNTLTSGGRISITGSNGNYMISDEAAGTYIDFQTINANNVLVGATAQDAILTFPSGITASVLGIVRLPARSTGTWTFKVFTWPSASLSADVTVINAPSTFGGTLTSTTSAGTANTTDFVGSGGGLVQATLTGTNAQLQAAGIYLVASND